MCDSFKPLPHTPTENAHGTITVEGCVGPRTGLDIVEKGRALLLQGFEYSRNIFHKVKVINTLLITF
jgi:hypothetical protein